MPDNLYARVYHLPARLTKARAKRDKLRRVIAFLGDDARSKDRQALAAADRRVRSLENEAKQYRFDDLVKSDTVDN